MRLRCLAISFFLTGIAMADVFACDVPVFSYAMQYWSPDPYRVYVFHNAPLSASEQRIVDTFRAVARHARLETNVDLQVVDIRQRVDASVRELYQAHLKDPFPGVVVQYPAATSISRPVYAGPLNEALLHDLFDSPMRRQIVENLMQGHVAVWVLLESGNRREDRQAADILDRELHRMAQVLQLPGPDLWAWSEDLETDSGARFVVLRLSRQEPEEQMLIRMLMHSEPDLEDQARHPIAFPIYGRGLIMYALVGAGINEWTIKEACEFLSGPCSCQVKASNPGTDLLLSANWTERIRSNPYAQPAPFAGFSDFFARGEMAAARLADNPDPVASAVVKENAPEGNRLRWWALGAACMAMAGVIYGSYVYVVSRD